MITTPRDFARHIKHLKRLGYETITMERWLNWRSRGHALPAKSVIINFDDAYRDVYENALPVLEEYGMGATLWVVAGLIGKTNRWDEKMGWASMRLMSHDELRDALRRGFEVGSHGLTHADLSQLDSEGLREEVYESKRVLENLFGIHVSWFCYPFGHLTRVVKRTVQDAGYEGAVSVLPGKSSRNSDRYLIPRIFVNGNTSMRSFRYKVHLGFDPLEVCLEFWRYRVIPRVLGRPVDETYRLLGGDMIDRTR